MGSKDAHLYGIQKKRNLQGTEIGSSTSLGFELQLKSLIASSKSGDTKDSPNSVASAGARPRPQKEDIFATHNRNVKDRAAKDLKRVDFSQKNSGTSEQLDEALWRRNQRRLDEKARLYDALKRGDIEDADEKYDVDFNLKWAEARERGEDNDATSSDASDEGDKEELVKWIDEFGRNRTGTKREAAREERQRRIEQEIELAARPERPEYVIYGDTVQSEAFRPEEDRWRKMEELAANRDKEATPPPASHYDAAQEVRDRGTGFFKFSADEEERKQQMENLEKDRLETEKARAAAREKARADGGAGAAKFKGSKRKQEMDETREMFKKQRAYAQADRFLENLMDELQAEEADAAPPIE